MDARLFARTLDGREIRRFTDAAIDDAISKALSDANKNSVSLDVDFDGEGVRGVIAAKVGDHWSVALVGEIKRGRGPVGGARVRFEW